VKLLLNLLFKQGILAVHHDCNIVAPHLLTAKLHSCYVQESDPGVGFDDGVGNFGKCRKFWKLGVGVGVGHFTSDSAIPVSMGTRNVRHLFLFVG